MQIDQQLLTVRLSDIGTADSCGNANQKQLLSTIGMLPFAGPAIVESFSRSAKQELHLLVFTVCWPIILIVANTNEWLKSHLGTFLSNVFASLVASLLLMALPYFYRRIRS